MVAISLLFICVIGQITHQLCNLFQEAANLIVSNPEWVFSTYVVDLMLNVYHFIYNVSAKNYTFKVLSTIIDYSMIKGLVVFENGKTSDLILYK